jgi:hypothetical protein
LSEGRIGRGCVGVGVSACMRGAERARGAHPLAAVTPPLAGWSRPAEQKQTGACFQKQLDDAGANSDSMRKKIESDPRLQAHLNGAGKIADGAGTAKYAGMKVDLRFIVPSQRSISASVVVPVRSIPLHQLFLKATMSLAKGSLQSCKTCTRYSSVLITFLRNFRCCMNRLRLLPVPFSLLLLLLSSGERLVIDTNSNPNGVCECNPPDCVAPSSPFSRW